MALYTNDSKVGSQHWSNYALWNGQISWNFMTHSYHTQESWLYQILELTKNRQVSTKPHLPQHNVKVPEIYY